MTGRFTSSATRIEGLAVIERMPAIDSRGFFERMFSPADIPGFADGVRQINRSRTVRKGSVRGMHFQLAPHAETKLVSCIRGEIFDVVVDARRNSPTFLQWYGHVLTADNHLSLLIPAGCAHGFQTLCDECELIYVHSQDHVPASERGLRFSDPRLNIGWPLPVAEVSQRDANWPLIAESFGGIDA